MIRYCWILFLLMPCHAADQTPHVWIFNGLSGDEEHHQFFEKNISVIRQSLRDRFKIPASQITVLYGPEEAGYDGKSTRENILAELEEMVALSNQPDAAPVWLILHGHANRIPGGANLNLPGPDLSTTDFARVLRDFSKQTPLVILATTAAGSDFLRALSAPGRTILASTWHRDPVSETEFPLALAAALGATETDADKNGEVSALEIFRACQQRVLKIYESQGYMVREHAQLDAGLASCGAGR